MTVFDGSRFMDDEWWFYGDEVKTTETIYWFVVSQESVSVK